MRELVGRLWQAQLGQPVGQRSEEGPGAGVGDHHGAEGQHRGLAHPSLDTHVGRLPAQGSSVPVGSDGDQDPGIETGEAMHHGGEHWPVVLDRAER